MVKSNSRSLDYTTQKKFEKVFFEANKQKILENKEKALELYTQALVIDQKSHATMFQMAKLYYQLEKYSEALYWAEKTVITSKRYNHWYSGQLAQFYNKFGKYSQSAGVFASMVGNEPEVRENYVEAASQYFNAKEYGKSVSILKQMQATFGIEMESSTRLEYVYTATNQRDKAVEEMERLVAEDPTEIRYKGFLAETYLGANQKLKAIQTLEEVIALDSTTGKAYFALFGIYSDEGEKELAAKNLLKAFKYDDVSLQQKMQASSLYFSALKRDTTSKSLLIKLSDVLVAEYPNQIEPLMLKGDIYGVLGDFEEARDYNREALRINAGDYKLWSRLIDFNTRLKDDKSQIEDTEKALELFPNFVELYTANGYAHINLKEYAEAIDIADQGLDIAIDKADKTELLLCQASAYGKMEDFDKADKIFDKALLISPFNSTVLNNYSFSLAERKTRLEYADSLIGVALKMEPRNPFFLDTKAWILYAQENYTTALKILNKCMEIDPSNLEYYEHAKAVFMALGNQTMVNDMQKKIDRLNEK